MTSAVAADGGAGTWALAHLDVALRFIAADPLFRREFGHSVLGSGLGCVVHPGFAGPLRARLDDLLTGEVNRLTHHTVMLRRDRTPTIVELTAVVARGRGTACVVLAVRAEETQRPFDSSLRSVQISEVSARVLECVAAGVSSAEVAKRLFLSKQGVEHHVGSLVRKLGANNRTCMVSMAYAAGVLLAGQWPPKVNPALVG